MGRNPHRIGLRTMLDTDAKRLARRLGFGRLPDFARCADQAILTTYFTSKRDPQRYVRQPTNSLDYIRPWYESMRQRGLHGRLFHDGLSASFTGRHETDRIRFLEISPLFPHSVNDHRFYVYRQFLQNYEAPSIFMTDATDLVVARDPFPLVRTGRLYVGDDGMRLGDNDWLLALAETVERPRYADWLRSAGNEPCLNAGVLGGETALVRSFIDTILEEFDHIARPSLNVNMLVFNYVAHRAFGDRVSTAMCSRYKRFERRRTDVPFIHK